MRNVSILAFLFAVSAATYLLAYEIGQNAAQIGAIYPVSAILTVIFAIFLLQERSKLFVKIGAVVLSFIGVLLVLL